MPIISYIKECTSFIAFASDNGLSANEFVLWHALLNAFNQRATGNVWSDGFIPVSNSRLLSFTPFGCGNSAIETMRKTRDRLIQRGLIRYTPGQRNKAKPLYQMVYFCPMEQPANVDNLPADVDNSNVTQNLLGNMQGKPLGKPLGNMQGKPLGKPLDISYVDLYRENDTDTDDTGRSPCNATYPVPEETHNHITATAGISAGVRARRGLPWYNPDDPDAECDETYHESAKARASIAQRILDHFSQSEIRRDSENIHGLMCDAMKAGMHPSLIQHAADKCSTTSDWERAILREAELIGIQLDSGRAEIYDLKLRRGLGDDEAREVLRNRRYIQACVANMA